MLLFDFRGCGGNPGRPSEAGLPGEVRAARRQLVETAGFRPDRIIYFGRLTGRFWEDRVG